MTPSSGGDRARTGSSSSSSRTWSGMIWTTLSSIRPRVCVFCEMVYGAWCMVYYIWRMVYRCVLPTSSCMSAGTSDEHISIVQYLKGTRIDGAVVITTPQEVSMDDVRKEINFCKKTGMCMSMYMICMYECACVCLRACVYICICMCVCMQTCHALSHSTIVSCHLIFTYLPLLQECLCWELWRIWRTSRCRSACSHRREGASSSSPSRYVLSLVMMMMMTVNDIWCMVPGVC
ncbi:hypothetical protein EON64_04740 [archaeon]|nr:MAG: hypothetical protein EON64_04740 [archaeon]